MMKNKWIVILLAMGIVVCLIFDGILVQIGIESKWLLASVILLAAAAVSLDWATGKAGK